MLASIRRFSKTWPAKALFGALVFAFGIWGVAGRLRDQGNDTAVAHVGDSTIEVPEVQRAYTQQMSRVAKQNGPDFQPTPALRQQVATDAVRQIVLQKIVSEQLRHLGVAVPDSAIRETTFSLPAFKGVNGQFDKARFEMALSHNNMDEASFIKLVRDQLGSDQLTGAISAGIAAPDQMLGEIFAYARETRIVSAVTVSAAKQPVPPAPTGAELHRYWANNPAKYTTPEYRRIKVVELSAQSLSHDMNVSEDDIKRFYGLSKATYDKPELRSVQILTTPKPDVATQLAAAWKQGLDWNGIQALAKATGASAIELTDARKAELPDAALAATAFSTQIGATSDPVKGALSYYVVKVTNVTPAKFVSLAQAHDELRGKIAVLKANDAMDDRVNKLEDAMAGGGSLDSLPQGLGVAAAEGTLDAQGNTPDGTPAPIPGYPALRDAIIAAAFKAKPGDPPQLLQLPPDKENPAGGYYAVSIDSITKPSQTPFDKVADQVKQDWTQAQMRHEAETVAASILSATQSGKTLAAAAQANSLSASTLPPIQRPFGQNAPPRGVPQTLLAPLFGMKQGDTTMVDTPDGFMVAQLQSINDPKPSSDPITAEQLRGQLTQSITTDTQDLFVSALQRRFKVTLNEAAIKQIAQP